VGDFNGDGKPDLVMTSYLSGLSMEHAKRPTEDHRLAGPEEHQYYRGCPHADVGCEANQSVGSGGIPFVRLQPDFVGELPAQPWSHTELCDGRSARRQNKLAPAPGAIAERVRSG